MVWLPKPDYYLAKVEDGGHKDRSLRARHSVAVTNAYINGRLSAENQNIGECKGPFERYSYAVLNYRDFFVSCADESKVRERIMKTRWEGGD